jgi:nitrogenase molybdenum-iron protein alpha/beta subunit
MTKEEYANKKKEQNIKKMHEAKIERMDKSGLSAQIGGLMHDAVNLVIAEKNITITPERITYWLTTLRKIADAEKEPKQIDYDAIRLGEAWQKNYNKECELAEIKKEQNYGNN